MKAVAFSNFMLLLLVGIIAAFMHFKTHFSGADYFRKKSALLQKQVEAERLNSVLAQYQLSEFHQQVAEILPKMKGPKWQKPEEGFQLRNLASVVGAPNLEKLDFANASSLFEQAKRLFRQDKHARAAVLFKQLIEQYPSSVHVVQAHFLLAESRFRQQRFDLLIETVDKMVTHYPENEMTGFALLRLGTVYEYEERPEDAIDLYKVVLKTYRNPDLKKQADLQLKAIEL
jgi:TolA-binding protein